MKMHFIVVDKAIAQWPDLINAPCGADIVLPRPVLTVDFEAATAKVESKSSLYFCPVCGALAAATYSQEMRYLYGILPAEEAHRANLRDV